MKTIRVHLCLSVVSLLLLSSCMTANENGVTALGGKGAYKSKKFMVTWDNEKSFNDATGAVTMIGGMVIAGGVAKSMDQGATARAANARKPTVIPGTTTNPVGVDASGNPVFPIVTPTKVIPPPKAVFGH